MQLSKTELIKIYEDMLLARRFEEKCAFAYTQGLIIGFCHLYTGQEAVSAGLYAAKRQDDDVITSYRCHVQALYSGESPRAVMGELMGKAHGSSKGKGGSMHIFNPEGHFWGGHGIVGAPAPLGTGIAFANKYKGSDAVTVAIYGDGASDQGQVFESYNMASLWNLPVLFVIENNRYSMGTSCARHSANPDQLYKRAESFGIEGEKIDGMDFFVCYEKFKEKIEYVRTKSRPFLLEVDTYRYRGHSMSDAGKYRSKDEVTAKKENDAIESLKQFLTEKHNLLEKDFEDIETKIEDIVEDSFEFSKAAPYPSESELRTDIM
jgi:pyruvate dehydrogenase E1 component alpha subunit